MARPDRIGDLHTQADSAKEAKLLAALPAAGLRVGLRRWSIGLRFERRYERQQWDQHASANAGATGADHFPDNCRGNWNVRDCGFDPECKPYLNNDAVAEHRRNLFAIFPQLGNLEIHIEVTFVMKIDCNFGVS